MPRAHSETQVYFTSHLRRHLQAMADRDGLNLTEAAESLAQQTGLARATIFRYMKPRPTIDAAVCKTLMQYFELTDITQLFTLDLASINTTTPN